MASSVGKHVYTSAIPQSSMPMYIWPVIQYMPSHQPVGFGRTTPHMSHNIPPIHMYPSLLHPTSNENHLSLALTNRGDPKIKVTDSAKREMNPKDNSRATDPSPAEVSSADDITVQRDSPEMGVAPRVAPPPPAQSLRLAKSDRLKVTRLYRIHYRDRMERSSISVTCAERTSLNCPIWRYMVIIFYGSLIY